MARKTVRHAVAAVSVGIAAVAAMGIGAGTAGAVTGSNDNPAATTVAGSTGSSSGSANPACIVEMLLFEAPAHSAC